MPMLKNTCHERYAQGLASGMKRIDAYVAAGYSRSPANATRLAHDPRIERRVHEILAVSAERAVISRQRIQEELACIAFSDLRSAVKWTSIAVKTSIDDDGKPVMTVCNQVEIIDSGKLPEAIARAIGEVSQTREGSLKIKMHDKMKALELLGKDLGMFVADEDRPPDQPLTPITKEMDPAQAREAYLETLKATPERVAKITQH